MNILGSENNVLASGKGPTVQVGRVWRSAAQGMVRGGRGTGLGTEDQPPVPVLWVVLKVVEWERGCTVVPHPPSGFLPAPQGPLQSRGSLASAALAIQPELDNAPSSTWYSPFLIPRSLSFSSQMQGVLGWAGLCIPPEIHLATLSSLSLPLPSLSNFLIYISMLHLSFPFVPSSLFFLKSNPAGGELVFPLLSSQKFRKKGIQIPSLSHPRKG